jgi:hypothetical protein
VKQAEVRDATGIGNDGFAIQDQILCREGRELMGDRLKAQRPIVARPSEHGRPSVLQVRLRAVAVEFDLVKPAPA